MRRVKLRYVAVATVLGIMLFMNYVMPMVPGLRSLGARVMVVASGSMRPFLNLGDIVVLKGVDPEEIEVGDVIAFNVAQRFQRQYNYPPVVTHRVVEVIRVGLDLYFQTKGDATEKDPFTVPARDVIGLYVWKIPYLGIPFVFLRSIYGMALLASYIVIDVTLDYGPAWWKRRRERENAMQTMFQEAVGIRRALDNLSASILKVTAPARTGATILLRRKTDGLVEVVEGSRPVSLTVRRRSAG